MPSKAPRELKELVIVVSYSFQILVSILNFIMDEGTIYLSCIFVNIVQDENKSKKGLGEVYEVSMLQTISPSLHLVGYAFTVQLNSVDLRSISIVSKWAVI